LYVPFKYLYTNCPVAHFVTVSLISKFVTTTTIILIDIVNIYVNLRNCNMRD